LDISIDFLNQRQIQGLVLDVDDTIVPIKSTTITPELQAWVKEISLVAKLYLVTNNPQGDRIGAIARALDIPYYFRAGKPSRRKLSQAVAEMELPLERIAMVGDRVFTDVLAGNRMGLFTILIEPIAAADTSAGFHLIRQTEFTIARALGVSLFVN
jgi:uncharacterized protein